MRLKIITGLLFLLMISGIYTASSLPFFTDSSFYKDYIIGYLPLLQKGLSIIMVLTGAYISNISLNLILTRNFASVIQSNTLAKKIFPLIHWAISIAIWIVSGLFILGVFGININALITGAGVGGLLFALASKDFISNLFGSLSLIFSKNFKIGDIIRVKGFEGIVEEISLSHTRLIDKKGTVIFMPNKLIISETVENLSMTPLKRTNFTCEIPASSTKELKNILDTIEKEVQVLGGENTKIISHIEGLTANGYTITLKLETTINDIDTLKKDIWILLGGKVRGEK
ncbi:MAG: mechanosensitive ion channel [Candidatus Gracilibacteria bacterium]|nr:mechanosensitive ion channel [Candidatus Gracilibacteria bacterium]